MARQTEFGAKALIVELPVDDGPSVAGRAVQKRFSVWLVAMEAGHEASGFRRERRLTFPNTAASGGGL